MIGKEGRPDIWISLNRYPIKAPPEAVRPASEEEELAIFDVDDILNRTRTFMGSQDVSFEDLGGPCEEITKEEVSAAFKNKNFHPIPEGRVLQSEEPEERIDQVADTYRDIVDKYHGV